MESCFIPIKEYYADAFSILQQAETSYSEGRFPHCCNDTRKFLEIILDAVFEAKKLAPNKGSLKLNDRIALLNSVLPNSWVIRDIRRIQNIGNRGSHSNDLKESDAVAALESAFEVCLWSLEVIEGVQVSVRDYVLPKLAKDIWSFDSVEKSAHSNGAEAYGHVTLSHEQKKLAELFTGKHFLNAPPGTGKTQLLTARLSNAISRFNAERVICLTFTSRAAQEMRNRMQSVLNSESVFIGNIHAFCLEKITSAHEGKGALFNNPSILDDTYREEFFDSAWAIAINQDTAQQEVMTLPEQIREWLELELGASTTPEGIYTPADIEESQESFQKIKSTSLRLVVPFVLLNHSEDGDLHELALFDFKKQIRTLFAEITSKRLVKNLSLEYLVSLIWRCLLEFSQTKERVNSLDFDDLIGFGLINVRGLQLAYDCIQLDEVQDLSPYQWMLVSSISSLNTHVFVVGDTEQSIYGFMGADTELLRKYTAGFEAHRLTQNFRSTPGIQSLLERYREVNFGVNKSESGEFKSHQSTSSSTLLLGVEDNVKEYRLIADAVEKIFREEPTRQVGVLCRWNNSAAELSQVFRDNGFKVFLIAQNDFMQHSLIRDWVSVLRAYAGQGTRVDWYRIVYRLSKSASFNVGRREVIKLVDNLYSKNIAPDEVVPFSISSKNIQNTNIFEYRLRSLVDYATDSSKGVVIFDTETTGLQFESSAVIQLAAVKYVNGLKVSEFNEYIYLPDDMTDEELESFTESQKVHKISNEVVNLHGRPLEQVVDSFFEYVEGCAIVAHNLPFDLTMLSRNIGSRLNSSDRLESLFNRAGTQPMFDTLKLARELYPGLESYKLESLLSHFRLSGVNSHNALDDVLATGELLKQLVHDISSRLDSIDSTLDRYANVVRVFQREWQELRRQLWSIDRGGRRDGVTTLPELCDVWMNSVLDPSKAWYSSQAEVVRLEAEEKLYPWIRRNMGEKGRVSELLNKYSLEIGTLKESDLIDAEHDKLVISTIHRSKGLEFGTVILPMCVDGQFPGWRPDGFSQRERELADEEDKRLLYVAMTRPKDKLIITYHRVFQSNWGNRYPKKLSPYLASLIGDFDYRREF
ncbi:3'-5' exonuclease [Umboniibacter marinipuniceus]|uniref:DNA 3'-5' helicase n=1 Tax=Umboniibacter marinipuniceus TaxID=569599 RepID=A0A3M0ABZ6_9GAMM|nr:3'-5' exonuclease [Umboniibacter marinipuniceus]RMA82681.1 superfamily I DNA/RNA helicase [Umboniibacter marinipuniceus]